MPVLTSRRPPPFFSGYHHRGRAGGVRPLAAGGARLCSMISTVGARRKGASYKEMNDTPHKKQ